MSRKTCAQDPKRCWTVLAVYRSPPEEMCCWLESCSALGVVLRLLFYEHCRSVAYPAATVQAGDPQGYETVPRLETTRREQDVTTLLRELCFFITLNKTAMHHLILQSHN